MKFNHLNVPEHWQHYWTRYPEGYTILEALVSWVSQVDDMVDNQNTLNVKVDQFRNEIDEFVGRFDDRLQDEVTNTLKDWQNSGFLDVVINEALDTKYHEMDNRLTAQLAQNDKITSIASKNSVEFGAMAGKQVHIYKWGSPYGGNDWCFVRTPPNYNPKGAPHEFVVLNHGNGWVMNGSLKTANFSSKTQFGVDTQNGGAYLNTGRSDYNEYSSPLIEAFLSEGYVVVGAQNDGGRAGSDAGYGNRETRNNIKLFFEHVVENYNVHNYCHMIGASNGAIATINASFLMGNQKIKSITLLYPLLNLHSAWENQYKLNVMSAYALGDETFSSFLLKTKGHDPMTAHTDYKYLYSATREDEYANLDRIQLVQNVNDKDLRYTLDMRFKDSTQPIKTVTPVSETVFHKVTTFNFPKIRCHYSMGDTVVPMNEHWLPFRKLLLRSDNNLYFDEEVTGDHGDYTHFEGLDGNGVSKIIAWTKL